MGLPEANGLPVSRTSIVLSSPRGEHTPPLFNGYRLRWPWRFVPMVGYTREVKGSLVTPKA